MNEEIKDQWVSALQSAEFEKADGVLHEVPTNRMCANGVLCDLAYRAGVVSRRAVACREDYAIYAYGEDQLTGLIPHEVREWAGLSSSDPDLRYAHHVSVAELNDDTNPTLPEIGLLIKAQL